MKAVVTGGAGFVGSHLCDHLIAQGYRVTVLDDLSTGAESNIAHLADTPAFEFVRGDVLDRDLVEGLISRADTVFHLASTAGAHTNTHNPLRALRANLHGTGNVLEAAVAHGARLMIASTREVGGENGPDGRTRHGGRLPVPDRSSGNRWSHTAVHGMDELAVRVHGAGSGLPCVIARLSGVIGPRQSGRYGMVVPRFADQALAGVPLTVYGSGTQQRCFASVFEIVPALVRLLDAPEAYGTAVDLGGREEVSVKGLADRIVGLAGSSSQISHIAYEDAYGDGYEDVWHRRPDLSAARRLVGYEPKARLDDILASVIDHRRAARGLPLPA